MSRSTDVETTTIDRKETERGNMIALRFALEPRLWLRISLVLVMLTAGCRSAKTSTRTSVPTGTSVAGAPALSPEAAHEGLAIGEREMLLGGGSIVIYAIEWPVAQPLHETNNPVLAADAEICAGKAPPSSDLPVSPFQFQLEVEDSGAKRSPSPGEKEPAFPSATLTAPACSRGWVTFVLRPGEEPEELSWATGRAGRELEAEWMLSH